MKTLVIDPASQQREPGDGLIGDGTEGSDLDPVGGEHPHDDRGYLAEGAAEVAIDGVHGRLSAGHEPVEQHAHPVGQAPPSVATARFSRAERSGFPRWPRS